MVPPPSVPAPEAEEQETPRERRRLPRPRQVVAGARERLRAAADSQLAHDARRTVARGVRAVVPVLAPVTWLGWVALGITVAALVVGVTLEWVELVVIAIAGGVLLAIAIGYVIGRTMYRIELDLAYTRVVVGERALGRIEIHSASSRPLMPATIEVPVGSAVASFHLPRMQPRDVHEDVFAIPTSRRAVLQVGPVRSVKGDPLGLLRRQVRWTEPVELFVHPRTVQLEETAPGLIRDLEGITTRDLTNSDIAFHALRDYVAGDDRRYIHWKSSARTGQLMVRQFEQTRRSVLALGLSTNPDDYGDPDELETAISVLGSLGLQAIRDEMDVVVRTSRRSLPATNGKRLLDGLSGVASSQRHDRLVGLAGEIGREHPGASVVMLHVGRGVDVATVRRATALLPSQARILVFQAVTGTKARVQPLGPATLVQLPSVTELPRVVRAVSEL
ncbi:DUF58 domain-containing protein [Agrococcus sp. SGAir0287]|uniref:DUF58 domain-containing protein n=1 Tax=Agrococcus sp. SGAir0287 TaxID=2070347 RepID=UPI0015863EBB|nr:DUF58 domain-containing protein [Agrococcus sp. SGAir0287]